MGKWKSTMENLGRLIKDFVKKLNSGLFKNRAAAGKRIVSTAFIAGFAVMLVKSGEKASLVNRQISELEERSVSEDITVSQSENERNEKNDLRTRLTELINLVASETGMKRTQVAIIYEIPGSSVSASSVSYNELYMVADELQKKVIERHEFNSESSSVYYNSLNDDTQNNIDFYEAVLSYIGEDEDSINNFKDVYEKLLTDKEANENIVEIQNGRAEVRDKFKEILEEAKLADSKTLQTLAILFSHDSELFKNDNIDKLTDAYVYP